MYLSWSIKTITNDSSDGWKFFKRVTNLLRNVSLGLVLPRPNHVEKNFVCRFSKYHKLFGRRPLTQFKLLKMTSSKSPKNWSDWNNTKHFTDYSRDSGTGKFVRFTIAALLFIPVGFLAYMTTI